MKIRGMAIVLAVGSVFSGAQADPGLDAATKQGVINEIAKRMADEYVFPDIGRQAGEVLSGHLAAGDYDALTSPTALSHRLTEDLRAFTHDKHVRVRSEEQPTEREAKDQKRAPRTEAGFARAELLDGNIAYVELNGFDPKPVSRPVVNQVMQTLNGTDALIIDLRGNGGGDPHAVSYLVSFFVDPKQPVHVNDQLWRKPGTDEYKRSVFQTEATPSSYLGKPVVILTGPGTFSGGEEFAYDMQALKLATLVGDVTGGGANPGTIRALPAGLSIFVPTGRPENPVTHANWEGRGVLPDVNSTASQAFAKAYEIARQAAGKPAPPVTATSSDPEAARTRTLWTPRSTAQPGSEAALRRSVAELQAGMPRYDLLGPGLAELIRSQLPEVQSEISSVGPLESVSFVEVDEEGATVFAVRFAKAEWLWSILLDEDGRIVVAEYHPRQDAR